MIIEGAGIITRLLVHKEHCLIVSIFSREYGKVKGLLRKTKAKYGSELVLGNWGNFRISARLSEHLGRLQLEITENFFSKLLGTNRVEVLNYIIAQLDRNMHENIAYPRVYDFIRDNLTVLWQAKDALEVLGVIFAFEILLLSELGFAINLQECAMTGLRTPEELYYLSPRTGAACIKEVGLPYHDKLFVIPKFFYNRQLKAEDVQMTNRILDHFLRKNEIIFDDLAKLRNRCIGYMMDYR